MLRTLTLDDCLHVVRRMRPEDRRALRAVYGDGFSDEQFAIDRYRTDGPAWTLLQGPEPVAILGLSMHIPVATAWLVATPDMNLHSWRKLVRHSRTVRGNCAKHGLRRVEGYVLGGWGDAAKFARRLGFFHEGVRRGAGANGEDFHMFGILVRELR